MTSYAVAIAQRRHGRLTIGPPQACSKRDLRRVLTLIGRSRVVDNEIVETGMHPAIDAAPTRVHCRMIVNTCALPIALFKALVD